jgi:hypothetical protein
MQAQITDSQYEAELDAAYQKGCETARQWLTHYQQIGVKTVMVENSSDACEYCQTLNCMVMSVEDALRDLPVPVKGCGCGVCTCFMTPHEYTPDGQRAVGAESKWCGTEADGLSEPAAARLPDPIKPDGCLSGVLVTLGVALAVVFIALIIGL